jgi:hypothetical protein
VANHGGSSSQVATKIDRERPESGLTQPRADSFGGAADAGLSGTIIEPAAPQAEGMWKPSGSATPRFAPWATRRAAHIRLGKPLANHDLSHIALANRQQPAQAPVVAELGALLAGLAGASDTA